MQQLRDEISDVTTVTVEYFRVVLCHQVTGSLQGSYGLRQKGFGLSRKPRLRVVGLQTTDSRLNRAQVRV